MTIGAAPSWERVATEPLEAFALFTTWLLSSDRIAPDTEIANRWAWTARRNAYKRAVEAAERALTIAEAISRPRAAALAQQAALYSQEIVASRLQSMALAPSSVSDSVVVSLMREQRQRERDAADAADAVVAPPPVPHAVLAAAFDGCSKEELAALERSAEIVAKYKKAAGLPTDDRIIEW